mmetsp:Transcript_24740/g.70394  ORF Transcript_24740/g.70394 Transcript_24740/m.70394 type:complete len:211 (-) Transcript_24740:151-783(-)
MPVQRPVSSSKSAAAFQKPRLHSTVSPFARGTQPPAYSYAAQRESLAETWQQPNVSVRWAGTSAPPWPSSPVDSTSEATKALAFPTASVNSDGPDRGLSSACPTAADASATPSASTEPAATFSGAPPASPEPADPDSTWSASSAGSGTDWSSTTRAAPAATSSAGCCLAAGGSAPSKRLSTTAAARAGKCAAAITFSASPFLSSCGTAMW